MASIARESGLPGELPVMASLVESGLRNLAYGHADSVGYFQMRQGIWNSGQYEGYLARPELQVRWFVDHALAVLSARRAAGDATYGEDPATWGEWIADIERPYEAYRGRYQLRLGEARTMLALAAENVAPFELGLTVGALAEPVDPVTDALAQQVLSNGQITLEARSSSDLVAGRVDPRVSAVLLEAAAREPISLWVIQTGHSYYVAATGERPTTPSGARSTSARSPASSSARPTRRRAASCSRSASCRPRSARPRSARRGRSTSPATSRTPDTRITCTSASTPGGRRRRGRVRRRRRRRPASCETVVADAAQAGARCVAPTEPRFKVGAGADKASGSDDPRFEVDG